MNSISSSVYKQSSYTPLPPVKNCNLCRHQNVCHVFMLFKMNIEPVPIEQNNTLKAENLAVICNFYSPKQMDE